MSLRLTIEFESVSHHGSGYGLAGLIDRTLLRDERGLPYLAGSALKGKLRHAARQLLASGVPEGASPPCETPCEGTPCLICQIFGSAWRQGSLVFRDAYPVEAVEGPILFAERQDRTLGGAVEVRATAAIGRASRTAMKYHLFTTETLVPEVRFESRIEGNTEACRNFLEQCCAILNCFGSGASRGLGRCVYRIGEIE